MFTATQDYGLPNEILPVSFFKQVVVDSLIFDGSTSLTCFLFFFFLRSQWIFSNLLHLQWRTIELKNMYLAGLEKIANKTFWYGIFQDEAYVKGISNQLWHLMNTISAFDGRLRKKLYVLYRRLFGYKQPAVWGMRAPHLQIIQSNKVNKRSLSKMNWKKI